MEEIKEELKGLKSLLEAQAINGKDVLTFEEACTYSGISKSHLYKLTSSNSIPCYKPGGKLVYFKRSELIDWLLSNRVSTQEELKKQASNCIIKNRTANQ